MKTITPAKLLRSLQEGIFRVTVPTDVAERARRAIQRMVEIG
jgi:quinolinate synthase